MDKCKRVDSKQERRFGVGRNFFERRIGKESVNKKVLVTVPGFAATLLILFYCLLSFNTWGPIVNVVFFLAFLRFLSLNNLLKV